MATQEWLSHQTELLGYLAGCREDLTSISEGADLDHIAESIQELQSAIEASNEEKMGEDEDEEDEEEEEEEDDEDE